MLIFENSNIFSYNPINQYYSPLATKTNLLPFQFHSSLQREVDKVELINDVETIDITSDISVKPYVTSLIADGCWYVYDGNSNVNVSVCGIYQLKITLTRGFANTIFYSNYFRITDKPLYYIDFSRADDLVDRLYNSISYKDRIYYYPKLVKRLENFEYIENQAIGNGLNQTDYQCIIEQYQYFAYADKFALQFFNSLQHNMIIELYNPILNPDANLVIDNIEKETNYLPDSDMYEITIILKTNKKEFTLCSNNFTVKELIINQKIGVNADNDYLIVNANNDYLVTN
jgi:hypothetical protein